MKRRRAAWFEQTAASLQRCAPGVFDPGSVVCPLCSLVCTIDVMSIEHVPAGALGGKPLVLTCQRCNNRTGSGAERLASEHEALLRGTFVRRAMKSTFDGVEVNVALRIEGDTMVIDANDKHNPPGVVDQWAKRLRARSALGALQSMELELVQPVDEYVVDIAWLKAAYLTLFAALGHAVVFSPSLEPVRAQIRDVRHRLIEGFCMSPGGDPSLREIHTIRAPDELEGCFLVRLGERGIVLPSPYRSHDPYPFLTSQLSADLANPASIGVMSDLFEWWPIAPVFANDGDSWGCEQVIGLVDPSTRLPSSEAT